MSRAPRRIPKAFQRRPSKQTLAFVQKLFRSRRKRSAAVRAHRIDRQRRRLFNVLQTSARGVRIWLVWFGGCAVVVAILFFLFSPVLTLQSIRINREDARLDIEETQRLLLPFFGSHLFFLSLVNIEQRIRDRYPEAAEINVSKRYPSEIDVTVYMHPLVADVYVGNPDATEEGFVVPDTHSGSFSFLTSDGTFLSYPFYVPSQDEEERLIIHLVDWAAKPEHRQQLFSAETIETISHARSILSQSFGHTVASTTVYLRAREFHIRTESVVFWFDLATPIIEQIDRYRMFLRSISLEDVERYIDLRLHDRVVYR